MQRLGSWLHQNKLSEVQPWLGSKRSSNDGTSEDSEAAIASLEAAMQTGKHGGEGRICSCLWLEDELRIKEKRQNASLNSHMT